MTALTARERLAVQLSHDREAHAKVRAEGQTYRSSEGVRGSELYSWFADGISGAGVAVNERTAMCVSAVWAAVKLLAETVSVLPLHIYRRTDKGRERVESSDLWWLFNESPWASWTAASAWQFVMACRCLRGDGYMRIHRASPLSPKIVGLEPLHTLWVDPRKNGNRIAYVISRPDAEVEVVDQDDMLHFPSLGFDGLRSISPLSHGLRLTAGIALAADEFAADFFKSKARSDLVLSSDAKMQPAQRDDFLKDWDERYSGARNAKRPVLLTGGNWSVERIGISAEDMQLLTTRQYQVEDIARFYGVPPHMIGKTDASTSWGSGIENMGRGFVIYTLSGHTTLIQQETTRKCWPRSLRTYAEHNVDALLEGDSAAQSEYFAKALGGPGAQGWMTVNEVRKTKNLPPIPGGDELIRAGVSTNDTNPGTPAGE